MIRVILDTNVLVSGLAGLELSTSTPGAILRAWLDGEFELIVSPDILKELERTLTKPYYRARRSAEQIEAAVHLIANQATVIMPTRTVSGVASHSEDDRVLSAAVSANADFLITGDKQLQRLGTFESVQILAPRAFLDELESSSVDAQ